MIRKQPLSPGIAIGADAPRLASGASSALRLAASADTYKNLSLFGDMPDKVRADYVEKPDEQKLVENAINGMLTRSTAFELPDACLQGHADAD
jgi:carboxyl-terminal processing protease